MIARLLRGAAWLAVAAVIGVSSDAAAQTVRPPAGVDEALRVDYVRRDLQIFADILGLENDQVLILGGLYQDYEQSVKAGTEAVRGLLASTPGRREAQVHLKNQISELLEAYRQRRINADTDEARAVLEQELAGRIRELRESSRPALSMRDSAARLQERMDELEIKLDAWRAEKQRLAIEFHEAVKAILHPEQAGRWPRLERALTRRKELPRGRLSGESIDLVSLVTELDADPAVRDVVAPVLERYEIELHDALQHREIEHREAESALTRLGIDGDHEGVRRLSVHLVKSRIKVRDVNDRHVEAVRGRLPEAEREEFARLARERGYPRVFRRTRADRGFAAVIRLPGLDDSARTTIEALQESYGQELDQMNEQLVALVRRHEPEELIDNLVARSLLTGGERRAGTTNALGAALDRRNEVGGRYLDQLRALLTEEQQARVAAYLDRNRDPDRDPDRDRDSDDDPDPDRRTAAGGR